MTGSLRSDGSERNERDITACFPSSGQPAKQAATGLSEKFFLILLGLLVEGLQFGAASSWPSGINTSQHQQLLSTPGMIMQEESDSFSFSRN